MQFQKKEYSDAQSIRHEMEYFCEQVLAEKPAIEGSLEFALQVMKVYEAGLLSEGNRIEIDE